MSTISRMLATREQMQKLNTRRLLAYKNSLMKVPETPDWDYKVEENNVPSQLTKASPEWIETYTALKEILSNREHIKRSK